MLPDDWQIVRRGIDAKLFTAEAIENLSKDGSFEPKSEAEVGKWLVQKGLITRYQAQLLIRGVSKGYFLGPYKLLTPLKENEFCRYFGAEHGETGERNILCVLRPDQPDAELANNFAQRVKSRNLPEMPPGQPTKVCRIGNMQVAVLCPTKPAKKKAKATPVRSPEDTTAGFAEPTDDDLPAVAFPDGFGSNAALVPDISNLLADEPASAPVLNDLPQNVADDDPIVDDLEFGAVTTGYELKRPKKKAKKKSWRPGPRTILATFGLLLLGVLVLLIRTQVLGY